MSKLVDSNGLPDALLAALLNTRYDKGDADYSITELISPPRVRALQIRHDDEVVEEAAERIYAFLGTTVHGLLEGAVKWLAGDEATDAKEVVEKKHGLVFEKRFFRELNGKVVSGQLDMFDKNIGIIEDYKLCSVWAVMGDTKEDWVQQMNGYRWLLHAAYPDIAVKQAKIRAIMRDWSKREAQYKEGYPKYQIETLTINLDPVEKTEEWLLERLAAHEFARSREKDGDIPLCTPEERWAKPERWAVEKAGRTTALRVLDTQAEAMAWLNKNQKPGEVLSIKHRPGQNTRCLDYCNVARWCPLGRKG